MQTRDRTGTTEAAVRADAARLVRVEKGQANAEELAAVTALLLARAAATARHSAIPAPREAGRSRAGWRRLERARGFRAPHSWQG
ncbi:acyl-CoA carboxylase epsilon subunit [Streptomyces ovatisporus]|uniref:Acyl-CoA carboxylase epsilon subunit n=1 Tax=Streptomyces ovatisporus TaxID=1128682 RepID=A0ABV9A5H0_9ACTN